MKGRFKKMELRDMARVIWKRLWLIAVIAFIASVSAGAVTYWFMPPVYEASTKLIVNKSDEEDGRPVLNWNTVTVNIQLIATYKELIRTAAIMDEVVRQNPDFGLTANELIGKVNVSSVNDTQVMTVKVQDESYKRAAQIVNAVSEVFQSKVVEIMKVDNVAILNHASTEDTPPPVSPNLKLNVATSFILASILGIGLVFLLEHLDDTIKNEDDIERVLGLSFLTSIHLIRNKDFSKQKAVKAARKSGDNIYVAANQ